MQLPIVSHATSNCVIATGYVKVTSNKLFETKPSQILVHLPRISRLINHSKYDLKSVSKVAIFIFFPQNYINTKMLNSIVGGRKLMTPLKFD